ncbi:MAG TPA: hypothetical protein VJM34_09610 [Novosphingobium sp.]|nr:hypothetical protein [Novosphingobium sp.]
MIRSGTSKSAALVSKMALGAALAFGMAAGAGVTSGTAVAAEKAAKAPKLAFSKGMTAVAGPAQKVLDAAKTAPDIVAAKAQIEAAQRANNKQQLASANAAMAAAIADEKAELEKVFAAIEKPDDRFLAGNMAVNLGSVALDPSLQRRGIKAMLESGLGNPADQPRFNSIAGQLAYQAGDYPEAAQYLQRAIDAGYKEDNSEVLLAEALIGSNQGAQGTAVLKRAIQNAKAGGTAAPEAWYRRGMASSFKAGQINDTAEFGAMLITDHPNAKNVGLAATIIRELAKLNPQETLDLMRLMGRSNSYAEPRDYIEYIEAADPRRFPGEVTDVINAGISAGALKANDTFVADAKSQAAGRIAADRGSLSGYEADARKASATAATVTGAADALLSYGQAAKAEELYTLALVKPGADAALVNTRLGIAQFDQGKYAAAQQSFGKVTGNRASIAKLWAAYAASKAGGAPTS